MFVVLRFFLFKFKTDRNINVFLYNYIGDFNAKCGREPTRYPNVRKRKLT